MICSHFEYANSTLKSYDFFFGTVKDRITPYSEAKIMGSAEGKEISFSAFIIH